MEDVNKPRDIYDFLGLVQIWTEKKNKLLADTQDLLINSFSGEKNLKQFYRAKGNELDLIKKVMPGLVKNDQKNMEDYERVKTKFILFADFLAESEKKQDEYIKEIQLRFSEIENIRKHIDSKINTLVEFEIKKLSPYDNENIWEAAKNGPLISLKYWIRETPHYLNECFNNTYTPLHMAIINKNLDNAKYLISKEEVDINQIAQHTETIPLHEAILIGDIELVKYLTESGSNIDWCDYIGETPLHYASKANNIEIIKYLVEKGANTKIQNKDYKTPVEIAADEIKEFFSKSEST